VIVVTLDLSKALAEAGETQRAAYLLDDTAEWIQRESFGPETARFFAELRGTSPPSSVASS